MRVFTLVIHWAYNDNTITSACLSSLTKAVDTASKIIQDSYLDNGFVLCQGFETIPLEKVKQSLMNYHSYENVNYGPFNEKIKEFNVYIHSNVLDSPNEYGGFEEE